MIKKNKKDNNFIRVYWECLECGEKGFFKYNKIGETYEHENIYNIIKESHNQLCDSIEFEIYWG